MKFVGQMFCYLNSKYSFFYRNFKDDITFKIRNYFPCIGQSCHTMPGCSTQRCVTGDIVFIVSKRMHIDR